jgi:hypothetical protein
MFARSYRAVRAPDGSEWTVHVARGNQWQGWRRVNRVNDNPLTAIPVLDAVGLFAYLVNVPPSLYRWVVHVMGRRTDWLVAVRPGGSIWGRLAYDWVLLEAVPGRPAAVARAEAVMQMIARDGPLELDRRQPPA